MFTVGNGFHGLEKGCGWNDSALVNVLLHKLRETIKTFESKENAERYKSQITLAKRRVRAFEIAEWFIANELGKDICDN